MDNLLVVAMLDYKGYSNNRIHHLIAQFKPRFRQITLMYKLNISERPLRQQFKTIWFVGSNLEQQDNFTAVGIDPILNYTHGLGLTLLKLDSPYNVPQNRLKKLKSNSNNDGRENYQKSWLCLAYLNSQRQLDHSGLL